MSREWSEDGDGDYGAFALWENALERAMNGKRGQRFLVELEAELLAMKDRGEARLLQGFLIADGGVRKSPFASIPDEVAPVGVCTLGVMAKKKCTAEQIEKAKNYEADDPGDFDWLKEPLNIAECLLHEIGCVNDDSYRTETDEKRFERMLVWVQRHISRNGEKVRR